jgi:UDP-N-acetylmuramyl pentapeptide phosphotransferase/UDP-N-acetylglucosamine-1-phosphate transferase
MILFYLAICIVSFATTLFVRKIAIHKSIMDHPNERSSHSTPTPRGGGLAIAIAWFAGLIYFYITHRIEESLFLALLSGLPLTLIGFADDLFSLKPGIRFLVQFVCAALALWFLGGLQHCQLSILNCQFPFILTPLAFIAIIWSINLFNFLDGIDGYISTEVIFIGISLFVLTGNTIGILLAASIGGFLIWNWPKAKIFMGDVGSTLLGFIVAVFAVYFQNTQQISIVVMLILTAVFWFDATVTLFRRILNKEKLSEAHRKHAFQRIVQAGWSHQKTTLGSLAINLVGFAFALLATKYVVIQEVLLVIYLGILYFVLRYIDKQKPFEYNVKIAD